MNRPNFERITRSQWNKAQRLLGYLKPYKYKFGLGILFLFLSSSASLAFPWLLGQLVSAASPHSTGPFDFSISDIALGIFIILSIQAVFSYFRIVIFVGVTERFLADLRQDAFEHIIKLPMVFFNRNRVGELNSRISADIAMIHDTFTTTLAEFSRQIITIAGSIIILVVLAPKLTLFMLAIFPAVIIGAVALGKYIKKFSKEAQSAVAESNAIVEETLLGIFNVKAFANEYLEMGRYTKKTNEVARIGVKSGYYRGFLVAFIIFAIFGTIVAVIWRGANMIENGELTPGDLMSFVLYSVFIGGGIAGLADFYAKLQKTFGATESLMDIMDQEAEPITMRKEKPQLQLKGAFAFKDLDFSYPTREDNPVLKGLNFEARPGEHLAVVGPSGAGKSTLVSLLLRFYSPNSGQISFDGQNAEQLNLSALRNNMAVVPQDVLLFGGSIRENIAYGKPGAKLDEIRQAAHKANALNFIENFENGFDTVVGDRGIQLSGGQRQRIAIARAILKDPAILILDEATSALDSESEKLVQDALNKLMEGRTSLVIAHRLSTIRSADKIIVLDKGRIVESGSHTQLLQNDKGIYKNLVDLQLEL